jgi:hypothetical protein
VQFLVKNCAVDVNKPSKHNESTALSLACWNGHLFESDDKLLHLSLPIGSKIDEVESDVSETEEEADDEEEDERKRTCSKSCSR